MKKTCVFAFACLWLGNAFAAPSAEKVGVPETELARIEQAIVEDLCPLNDIEKMLFKRNIGENYYTCNVSIKASQLPIFSCFYNGVWDNQRYESYHTISCNLEAEEQEESEETE